MNRLRSAVIVVASLVVVSGCGSSQPAPAPTPATQPAATQPAATQPVTTQSATAKTTTATTPPSSPVPAAGTKSNPPTTPAPPITTPSIAAPNNLRELAARYLEGDGSGGWRTNEQAALELEKLGPDVAARLLPLLADQQADVRRGAAYYLLGSFNSNEPAQVRAFSALLGDADRTIRGIGLSAARQMRPEDQAAALPRLAAMLDPAREDKPANRETVARLLAGLKSSAAESIEPLAAAAVGDPVANVRMACLIALSRVAEPKEAAPLVAKGLADKEPAVRRVAAVRLRQIGAGSEPVSQELAAALADSDPDVRAAAAETLVKVGEPAVSHIVGQLATDSLDARKLALYCLINIGPAAKDAAPLVEKCLADNDADVKKLAAAALASIRGK